MKLVPDTWLEAVTVGASIGIMWSALEALRDGNYGKALLAAAIGVALTLWKDEP